MGQEYGAAGAVASVVKRIGFLSFGHYQDVPGSLVRDAGEAYRQAVELAVAAEEVGADGAFVRVHHFAPQHSSPIPLLSAMAARTSRIELGTGVIDMRYENPLYLAEEAAVADLISEGRLQLGISRGSPEPADHGWRAFGYPDDGMPRDKAELFLAAVGGAPVVMSDPAMTGQSRPLAIDPQSPGLDERIWWGAGSRDTAVWAAEKGFNLMSSTLVFGESTSLGDLQAEQIAAYREAWNAAGHERSPRVSVSRSIIPLVTEEDHHYFGLRAQAESRDQVGIIDNAKATFGRSYIGEPDELIEQLADDAAVADADTLLITVPNQLGVDFNARLLESIVKHVAPGLGWR
ncbi:LLM class flavin-dependent oxidoreductase [Salinibacterium sp. SYSU T00001]|uniref:LLM class flavin-dependent oxidoreductase n=1 Tax=Homoserinimonas sedimenticola TaxID=2986805 RepID=UPI0022357ED1|nr:LLM class flavin-dependent oxidoreductase [Salinibacterium sedimenticola]MCW4385389.1 LLM class flavin-dependent oxidoreductase [Salinibacterium sedimenticola]